MAAVESIVVALIVACAAMYAAWILMPQALRARIAASAGRCAAAAGPMPAVVRRLLRRFADSQMRRTPGCAGCSSAKTPAPSDRARRQ